MRGLAFIATAVVLVTAQGVLAQNAVHPSLTAGERTVMAAALQGGEERTVAPAEAFSDSELEAALMRHATVELGLRVAPGDVDPLWAIMPPRRQVAAEYAQARHAGRLELWLQSLSPASASYRALVAAGYRYRQIVANGGWSRRPMTLDLRLGAAGRAVVDLRSRLAVEGYLVEVGEGAEVFDVALRDAVATFQRHHDLEADGIVGRETREALNVTAEQRLAQIEANLERWRWVRSLPPDRLEVNVAAAQAVLYADDAPTLTMRTVVGDLRHHTPMFTSRLASVVINPPWNVPASIATNELWPKEAAQPGYLGRNGFSTVNGALRQAPGPRNSLGRLKFDFPSPFGVYLHDTPGRDAFARSNRALSHGCIRLEKPRELAAALLAPSWTADQIDAAIDSGQTQRVQLDGRLPLFVLYWTVTPQDDGSLQFHPDRYGWDAKLMTALARKSAVSARHAFADTDCAAKSPSRIRHTQGA